MNNTRSNNIAKQIPPASISIIPIIFLLVTLLSLIIIKGAGAVNDWSPFVLLSAAAVSLSLYFFWMTRIGKVDSGELRKGLHVSAKQILPAVPVLFFIAILSTTWMLGGVVPTFINYGLHLLNPKLFLVSVCAVSACISVLTGSSWTTIATIGVAFMGIGQVLGYSDPWIAGAIISGAYFGDKVSPLSDTTVVASSSCGVDLFTHIRYLLLTAGPSMGFAMILFLAVGILKDPVTAADAHSEMLDILHTSFNITPWVLLVPVITLILIALRLNTILTLAISSGLGVVAMALFQPQLPLGIGFFSELWNGAQFNSTDESFNRLVSTGGVIGMLPTIYLVLSAMIFGGVMIGTGMLRSLSGALTNRIRGRKSILAASLGSGLMLNSFTADQYLSIIIGANMYKDTYSRAGMEPKMLSRSLEDSISVTSVLIPWNSCGLTQSAVLGVSTLVYAPFCIFNWVSPIMSFLMSAGMLKFGRVVFARFRKVA